MIGCITAEGIAESNKTAVSADVRHADEQGPLTPAHLATLRQTAEGAPPGSSYRDHMTATADVQHLDFATAADRHHALGQLGPREPSGDPSALGPERVAPTGVGATFRHSPPREVAGVALYGVGRHPWS